MTQARGTGTRQAEPRWVHVRKFALHARAFVI
jgi:hypothetical protein